VVSTTDPESVRVNESRAWKVGGALLAVLSFWFAKAFFQLSIDRSSLLWLVLAYLAANTFVLAALATQVWMNGFSTRSREIRIGLALKSAGFNLMAAPQVYPIALLVSAMAGFVGAPAGLAQHALVAAKATGTTTSTMVGATWYVLASVLWAVGIAAIRLGYRRDAFVESQRVSIDPRPCVLYLRSFAHDDTTLWGTRLGQWRGWRIWRAWWPATSFEQDLASVLSGIGPLVTVGRPGESLPQLGAQRRYFEDHEWQQRVLELMEGAALVVIRCGSTGNLWWELEQALRVVPRSRLLVLSLGSDAERSHFEAELEQRVGPPGRLTSLPPVHVPLLLRLALLGRKSEFGRLVSFSERSLSAVVPVHAGFNPLRIFQLYFQFTPYRGPLLTAFRKSFLQRNLDWAPPAPRRAIALYLALNFGFFGTHHFYLREARKGWLSLAFSCTCVPQLLSIVDALRMLLMTQEQFAKRYIANWDCRTAVVPLLPDDPTGPP
jgi:TM2 domain-containing membrane protein YozV